MLMHFIGEKKANADELVNAVKYRAALLASDQGAFPN